MQGQLTTKDTYIDGHNVNGNNGEEGVIYIGRSTSLGAPLVGLIRFATPTTAGQFTASLRLVPSYCSAQNGYSSVFISLAYYPLEWDEPAASWTSLGGMPIDGEAPTMPAEPLEGSLDVTQAFDVTQLIQCAIQQGREYIDLLLHPASDTRASCSYYSKDSGTHPERGPRLMVLNG